MSLITALAAIAVVIYMVGQQIAGSAVRGRRLLVLPVVLTAIGIAELSGGAAHPGPTDIVLLVLGGAIAVAIGAGLGVITRVESRNGNLWTQLPARGLWLWAGLIVSRVLIIGVAHATGAHVAAGTGAILLMLGLNRAAQALVVAPRAITAGIPFAPEKDGSRFAAGWFGPAANQER